MSGFVADTTSYKPWIQNVTPTFTPSINTDSLGTFSPGVYGWGTTVGNSSSSSESYKSQEDYQKAEAKANKEKLAKVVEISTAEKELEVSKKKAK